MCAERDESELDGLDPGLRAYASSDPPDQPVTRSHSNADRADKARAGPDSSDDAGKAGNDEESGLHLPHLPHLPVPQLIEPEEDRWRWRARIRRDPRQLFFYRIGVGVAGLVLMIAAMMMIHDYTIGKALFSSLLTIVTMMVIIFLIVIFFSLITQSFGYFVALYKEVAFRLY